MRVSASVTENCGLPARTDRGGACIGRWRVAAEETVARLRCRTWIAGSVPTGGIAGREGAP
jgi:hypothetical protein